MRTHLRAALAASLLFFFVSACKKQVEPQQEPSIPDLSQVKITDFKFAEVNNSDIDIVHPVLVNNVETEPGKITIQIPRGNTGLQLTPLAGNFQRSGYTISPQLGVKTNYLNKEVMYTITNTANPQFKVRYKVTVQEEAGTNQGPLALTNVRFLKANNPQLSEDIAATQVIQGNGNLGKVYVFVPAGTNFSTLTATLEHNGDEVRYTQSSAEVPANSTTVYPGAGMLLDLAYPKGFYVAVKRGTEVAIYSIVVDVLKPIVFVEDQVTLSGLQAGASHTVKAGELINKGNRPLTITQIQHTEQVPANSPLRTFVTIPSGGLLPGQKADVTATFNASQFPAGNYEVKATMRPGFVMENDMQALLQSSMFQLKVQLQ